MKIIQPAHNKVASPVTSWAEIKEEAKALREFVNHGKFEGNYDKAFAISHVQVSDTPKSFFVVHKDFEKLFGTWCVINQSLAPKKGQNACREPVEWEEACMSFPYRKPKRTERFMIMRVTYKAPFFWSWRTITRELKELPAFIIQHEAGLAAGTNIYGLN